MTLPTQSFLNARGTRAHAELAARERARWDDPTWLTDQLAHALANRVASGWVLTRAEAAAEFVRVHPAARTQLGDAVIAAAVPRTAPSCCRWRYARTYAVARNLPTPTFGAVVARLLGPPCARCAAGLWSSLRDRVAAGRRTGRSTAAGTPTARVTTATGRPPRPVGPPTLHAADRCAACDAADRLGLTAAALPPHRPTGVALPRPLRDALLAARGPGNPDVSGPGSPGDPGSPDVSGPGSPDLPDDDRVDVDGVVEGTVYVTGRVPRKPRKSS